MIEEYLLPGVERVPVLDAPVKTEAPPLEIGIVVPARDSARTARRCLLSLLAQDYPAFRIYLVSGPPEVDTTLSAVQDLVADPRVTCLQWTRPLEWNGRDGSVKRKLGALEAIANGAEVVAFLDSQAEAPPSWLSAGVQLLRESEADGVAGISQRRPADRSFAAIYQDASMFSEWPKYRQDRLLFSGNTDSVGQLPVTNNLFVKAPSLARVLQLWPQSCPYGWEDFHLDHALLETGSAILCTKRSKVYRLHKPKLRLAKHVTAGMAAANFYRAFPNDRFIKLRLQRAALVLAAFAALVAMVTAGAVGPYHPLLAVAAAAVLTGLVAMAALSARAARDWRALFFPLIDALHIWSWMAGLAISFAAPEQLKYRIQHFLGSHR